jgi:hypothetical protein
MSRAQEIILYTRPDCHLCELAAPMLQSCGAAWHPVDIESDLELIRKYGIRIPVLYRADIDRELFWPFTTEAVKAFTAAEI